MRARDWAAAFGLAVVVVAAGYAVADASVVHHGCHAALVRWFDSGHGDSGRAYRHYVAARCGRMTPALRNWIAWFLDRASS
jgi:DNA-binding transcriptional LysR family regulator